MKLVHLSGFPCANDCPSACTPTPHRHPPASARPMRRRRRRLRRVGRHARDGRKPASASPMHDRSVAVLSLFPRCAAATRAARPAAAAHHADGVARIIRAR
ncbi:uncharacterized protein BCN122_III0918 [Burkholderia cenocepacia]|nr:uncharacterized protein BCN122_III0918 [Burkholderia cenocepacia]